jgi:hypothetical protein
MFGRFPSLSGSGCRQPEFADPHYWHSLQIQIVIVPRFHHSPILIGRSRWIIGSKSFRFDLNLP